MQFGKRILPLLCAVLMLFFALPAVPSGAAAEPSLVTTLTDNAVQRGSKKTFDVWARNAGGEKIRATVTHNGTRLEPTWDDSDKASYTLTFTEEGENIVTVSASSDGGKKKELTYRILYRHAEPGEEIGRAVWSVEAFTIGCGYIVEPVEMPILEGETAAELLLRLLTESGLTGYYGGTEKASFYLAYIADGTAAGERYNGYLRSAVPQTPRRLELSPAIPSLLTPHLESSMTYFDPDDYGKNWVGYLGEFAFTNGSGWMYTVNNVFPNVGFADSYLSDGDVVRVQFTLGYGADIGGFAAVGSAVPDAGAQPAGGYYPVADKDKLTEAICRARTSGLLARTSVGAAYGAALDAMAALDAAQETVDAATAALYDALEHPDAETQSETGTHPDSGTTREPDSTAPEPDTDTAAGVTETAEGTAASSHTEPAAEPDSGTGTVPRSGCRSTVVPTLFAVSALAAAALPAVRRTGRRREGNNRDA